MILSDAYHRPPFLNPSLSKGARLSGFCSLQNPVDCDPRSYRLICPFTDVCLLAGLPSPFSEASSVGLSSWLSRSSSLALCIAKQQEASYGRVLLPQSYTRSGNDWHRLRMVQSGAVAAFADERPEVKSLNIVSSASDGSNPPLVRCVVRCTVNLNTQSPTKSITPTSLCTTTAPCDFSLL